MTKLVILEKYCRILTEQMIIIQLIGSRKQAPMMHRTPKVATNNCAATMAQTTDVEWTSIDDVIQWHTGVLWIEICSRARCMTRLSKSRIVPFKAYNVPSAVQSVLRHEQEWLKDSSACIVLTNCILRRTRDLRWCVLFNDECCSPKISITPAINHHVRTRTC